MNIENKVMNYNPAIEGDILDYGPEPEKFAPINSIDTLDFNRYFISSYGRVIDSKSKCIYTIQFVNSLPTVQIRDKNKKRKRIYVHKLVANNFIPKTKDDIFYKRNNIRFKDGNKSNIHVWNLQWENISNLRNKPNVKLSIETIKLICEYLEKRKTINYIVKQLEHLGVTYNTVYNIATKRTWEEISKNYNIKYENNLLKVKMTPMIVRYICKMLEMGHDVLEIKNSLNFIDISYSTIYHIATGVSWKHISKKYNINIYSKRGEKKTC